MAFCIRETFPGLEHLRLALCRTLFRMKADAYLKRYSEKNLQVEVKLNKDGLPVNCETCGFVIIKVAFATGWQMEMCSALPVVELDKPALNNWLTTLADYSQDSNGRPKRNLEPILRE